MALWLKAIYSGSIFLSKPLCGPNLAMKIMVTCRSSLSSMFFTIDVFKSLPSGQRKCFPMKFAEFLRTPFLYRTSPVAACGPGGWNNQAEWVDYSFANYSLFFSEKRVKWVTNKYKTIKTYFCLMAPWRSGYHYCTILFN